MNFKEEDKEKHISSKKKIYICMFADRIGVRELQGGGQGEVHGDSAQCYRAGIFVENEQTRASK